MEFGQLMETFFLANTQYDGWRNYAQTFFLKKNISLSISLDQQSKIL